MDQTERDGQEGAELELDMPEEKAREPHEDAAAPSAEKPSAPAASAATPRSPDGRDETPGLRLPFREHLLGLLLALAGVVAVAGTPGGQGWSWDEAYYYEPAKSAAEFVCGLIPGGAAEDGATTVSMWSGAAIDAHWSEIKECPAVVKVLSGFSRLALNDWLGEMQALRFPSALLFGLTLYLIFIISRAYYGALAAFVAVAAYATMPRVFGHAHFAATETTTNFMLLLAIYCFLRGLTSWKWAVVWGVVFGLALNTKINAILLPAIVLPWALIYRRRASVNNLFAMLLLGPLVWVLTWPWLWRDTAARLVEYIDYFAQHSHIGVFYLREMFGGPPLAPGGPALSPAPWHYPLTLTAVATPLPALALFGAGAIRMFAKRRVEPQGVLFGFFILVALGVACRPSAAKYDGLRLFLSIFPFVAILAGAGAAKIPRAFSKERIQKGANITWRQLSAAAVLCLALGGGGYSVWRTAPRYLSYYNILCGDVSGKALSYKVNYWGQAVNDDVGKNKYRFEVTYWDVAANDGASSNTFPFEVAYWGEAVDDDVIEYLNENCPPNAKVKPLALHGKAFEQLQKDFGRLRKDLIFNAAPPYDVHILQHRRGLFRRAERSFAKQKPDKIFFFRGAPLISVYLTPPPPPPPSGEGSPQNGRD